MALSVLTNAGFFWQHARDAATEATHRRDRGRFPIAVHRIVPFVRVEPTEAYVHRHNIAHYRSLLDTGQLDEVRRASIERLLAEEEAKYNSSASQD